MKVKIKCPKCGSENVSIASDPKDPTPLYKCNKCGYKHRLFPDMWKKEEGKDEEENKGDF